MQALIARLHSLLADLAGIKLAQRRLQMLKAQESSQWISRMEEEATARDRHVCHSIDDERWNSWAGDCCRDSHAERACLLLQAQCAKTAANCAALQTIAMPNVLIQKKILVRLGGIEPTTLGFGGQYSIH